MPILQADIESITSDTATTSFAVLDEMTVTFTPASSGSVILLLFAMTAEDGATDTILEFDFWEGGTKITGSPTGLAFIDNVDEIHGTVMMHAVTGYTGSKTFAVAWREEFGVGATDTSRPRTFKVIELLAAEATLLTDVSVTSTAALVTPAAVITDMTDTKTTASGAMHLMIGNFFPDGASPSRAILQFGIDSTIEGPAAATWLQSSGLFQSTSMAWMRTGLSAASHTFQWYGDEITGAVSADTGFNRTLQVVEITANATVLSDLSPTSASTSDTAFATMTGMSASVTPNNSSSILLLLGTASSTGGADQSADLNWSVGGTQQGVRLSWFADGNNQIPGVTVPEVATGVSGSTAFALEWADRNGKPSISVDTSYDRSFQVIDFEVGAPSASTFQPAWAMNSNVVIQ